MIKLKLIKKPKWTKNYTKHMINHGVLCYGFEEHQILDLKNYLLKFKKGKEKFFKNPVGYHFEVNAIYKNKTLELGFIHIDTANNNELTISIYKPDKGIGKIALGQLLELEMIKSLGNITALIRSTNTNMVRIKTLLNNFGFRSTPTAMYELIFI